ncbi:unnamed protein product [Closterium sp. Naga37s-1]|nr:unnamed protein product [Closterium sp. Naga37s-1]
MPLCCALCYPISDSLCCREFQELISARTLTPPGRLPADIAAFTALQVLNLAGQNLSGPIPTDAFRNLTSLQELDLSSNPLSGSMEFLAFLPALQHLYAPVPLNFTSPCVLDPLLKSFKISCMRTQPPICPPLPTHGSDLHATELTGEIPTALGNATALSYLSLAYINLTAAELHASLSALTRLAHLLGCKAPSGLTPARSSPFPAEWTALTSLNTLRAAGNGFSDSLSAAISALTALSELSLSHNALEGPFSASPAAPQLLEVMDISHNALSGGQDVLARMTNISTLLHILPSPPSLPTLFLTLPAPPSLPVLLSAPSALPPPLACPLSPLCSDISNNSFTGPFPSAMLSAPLYKRLDISHNQFSGVVPLAVFTLPSLTALSIAHNQLEGSLPATGLSEYLISLYARTHAMPGLPASRVSTPTAAAFSLFAAAALSLLAFAMRREGQTSVSERDADVAPAIQGNGKAAVKEAEEEDGYLSDDPEECQDPDAVNDIASQAGFAITLLIPAKWIEEVPRTMDTVRGLLLLWEEHLTENAKITMKCHKLTPAWLSKERFGRIQVVFERATDANFMWSRKVEHVTMNKLRLTLGWLHPENQEYLKERSSKLDAIEVLLKNVPAVITPEMVRKSLVTVQLLKRKRTAFLEGSAFHRVVDRVTGSDTDKIKGLVYRHPGDKLLQPQKIQLTSVPSPLRAAASLKLTSATKAIMEDPAMVFTSTNGAREEWLCVQEGCGKAHGVSFAKAAEHAASVMHCTERLKAGSATRQSRGKMNLLAVKREFGM